MIVLRPQQESAVSAIIEYWRAGGKNPIAQLPTGLGKSLVLAETAKRCIEMIPYTRVFVLAHSANLVEQNYEAMMSIWPLARAGIYCAELKRKDKDAQILFASVQSIAAALEKTGGAHVVLVDEADRMPPVDKPEALYNRLLRANAEIVPRFRVAGVTATPWRAGHGPIWGEPETDHFDDRVYECGIKEALDHGYLVPPIVPAQDKRISTAGLTVSSATGDYVQGRLAEISNVDEVNIPAVEAHVHALRSGRTAGLVFCVGIDHAERVDELLKASGVNSKVVHSKMPLAERRAITKAFKSGKIETLVSVESLLIGFDAKHTDLLTVLRSTESSALWLQALGRGMRCYEGKQDCLVLDFTENAERFGPIDLIGPPPRKKKRKSKDEDLVDLAGLKECTGCKALIALGAQECPECGQLFGALAGADGDAEAASTRYLKDQAAEVSLISSAEFFVEFDGMMAYRHEKEGKADSLRLDFYRGGDKLCSHWLAFESYNQGAIRMAIDWWTRMGGAIPTPLTTDEAIERSGELMVSGGLKRVKKGDYYNLKDVRSKEAPPARPWLEDY